jgi:hypothetical protein
MRWMRDEVHHQKYRQLSDWRKGEFQPPWQLQSKAVQNRRICGLAWPILFSSLLE